jgi:hypothetical protein
MGQSVVDLHMGWVRTNRRLCGALALLALAVQLALSFGHVHVRDFAGIPGTPVAHAQVSAPGGPDGRVSDDNYCLVCATVALSGTLFLPTSPFVFPPSNLIHASIWYPVPDQRDRFDRTLFSARAPPLA